MAELFCMPKLGMDMKEGTVSKWLKAVGEPVYKGEPLVEIETDKSTLEVEVPATGVLLAIYCESGETVPVNTPIAAIGAAGEQPPSIAAGMKEVPEAAASRATAPQANALPIAASQAEQTRIRISPRAKRLALQNGVDIAAVVGTGEAGRIMERDVAAAMQTQSERAERPKPASAAVRVPMTGARKVTATRMKQSLLDMAQANHRMDADMTELLALRKRLNTRARDGATTSIVDLMLRACAAALIAFPDVNATMREDGIYRLADVNLGIAVATERGLVVPVVHGAGAMTLAEISVRSKALIQRAQDGALTPDEMTGGTFTLTNLGMYDVDSFTAIINPPEAAILAVGRIRDRAVVRDGQIVIRPIATLSLTYDHRILDGAPAAEFLRCIKQYIEEPALML